MHAQAGAERPTRVRAGDPIQAQRPTDARLEVPPESVAPQPELDSGDGAAGHALQLAPTSDCASTGIANATGQRAAQSDSAGGLRGPAGGVG